MNKEYIKTYNEYFSKELILYNKTVDKNNNYDNVSKQLSFWMFLKEYIKSFETEEEKFIYYGMCIGGYRTIMDKIYNLNDYDKIYKRAETLCNKYKDMKEKDMRNKKLEEGMKRIQDFRNKK